jgi:tRNA A58 N-methylase Trm61
MSRLEKMIVDGNGFSVNDLNELQVKQDYDNILNDLVSDNQVVMKVAEEMIKESRLVYRVFES